MCVDLQTASNVRDYTGQIRGMLYGGTIRKAKKKTREPKRRLAGLARWSDD